MLAPIYCAYIIHMRAMCNEPMTKQPRPFPSAHGHSSQPKHPRQTKLQTKRTQTKKHKATKRDADARTRREGRGGDPIILVHHAQAVQGISSVTESMQAFDSRRDLQRFWRNLIRYFPHQSSTRVEAMSSHAWTRSVSRLLAQGNVGTTPQTPPVRLETPVTWAQGTAGTTPQPPPVSHRTG